ncbi:ATP-binding protein, partial [Streptomyces sp. NPDC054837]
MTLPRDPRANAGSEQVHLRAEAAGESRIYQARRDLYVSERDLHIHYVDGVRSARRAESKAVSDECPYPGLVAFGPQQARWFFGRDAQIAELLVRLDERLPGGDPLAVIAPSGAGKSSLLRAGLLAAIARGALPGAAHWPRLLLTPTAHPVTALATALTASTGVRPGRMMETLRAGPAACGALLHQVMTSPPWSGHGTPGRFVIVVDQLEELFTLCTSEEERLSFLALLSGLSHEGLIAVLVFGLRSDFYTPCTNYPQLLAALRDSHIVVGPMSVTEIREAILYPAQSVGLEVEPGLVDVLLRDLGGSIGGRTSNGAVPSESSTTSAYEAGRLPLLAHALRATWQQRQGGFLTVGGYQATGGIAHAVATTAERRFADLDPAGQEAAGSLFLRLIRIGDGTDDTRRRLSYGDLVDHGAASPATAAIIDIFTDGRLLTQEADTIAITHEVLLRAWPRLRQWIDTDRATHLVRQELEEAAADWDRAHRDTGMLYRGSRLAASNAWAGSRGRPELTSVATEFLNTSRRHARRAVRLK